MSTRRMYRRRFLNRPGHHAGDEASAVNALHNDRQAADVAHAIDPMRVRHASHFR